MDQQTDDAAAPYPSRPPLPAEDIRGQLARVLKSADFEISERAHRFLAYVVEEALAGRSDHIKGYTIAIEVFDRNDDFDTLNDPVVRIEAARLRRALERYYLLSGKGDPIEIDIPKGGYAPRFRHRNTALATALVTTIPPPRDIRLPNPVRSKIDTAWIAGGASAAAFIGITAYSLWAGGVSFYSTPRPYVVVRPFENFARNPEVSSVATHLSEEVVSLLSANHRLSIYGGDNSVEAGADTTRKRYVVIGTIREGNDKIRIICRLVEEQTGQILWSHIFEGDVLRGAAFEHDKAIATEISMSVSRSVLPTRSR